MSDKLKQLIMGLAKELEERGQEVKPILHKFATEDDALTHLCKVAALRPGDIVTFQLSDGLHRGVFQRLDEHCRPLLACFDPEDSGLVLSSCPCSAIIFDNMPAERTDAPQPAEAPACENCEDDEWDGAGPADEFPRT